MAQVFECKHIMPAQFLATNMARAYIPGRKDGKAMIKVRFGRVGRVDICRPTPLEIAALALLLVFLSAVIF
jgi:hypothetical protein